MAFKKGISGNPNGKEVGTLNKMTVIQKERLQMFFEHNFPKVQANYDQLDAKDQLTFMLSILEYFMPKMARIEITDTEGKNPFDNIKVTFVDGTKGK